MSAPALCREWWANLGARARAGVIFFPPRVRVLPPYTLVYFLASQSGGLFRFFLPTETDPCAVAFSFHQETTFNFYGIAYVLVTASPVSLCHSVSPFCTVSPCINVSPYTVSVCTLYVCITLYHCMYLCTVSHCINVSPYTVSRWAAQRPMKPGAVLYAAIDRGKQLATRELEPRRATPFELPPTANTSFARPLGRATLCTMAPPAAQACATRGVRSLQRSSPRSSASVRQAPRCRATDVNLDGERRATTCLVAVARATAPAVPW